jgi:hypothetical protein
MPKGSAPPPGIPSQGCPMISEAPSRLSWEYSLRVPSPHPHPFHHHKHPFPPSQRPPIRPHNLRRMKQLAPVPPHMVAPHHEPSLDRHRPQIIHLQMPRHRQNLQRPVQLAHCLIQQCRNDPAMHVSRWALMHPRQRHYRRSHQLHAIDLKLKPQPLRIPRPTPEAMAPLFVNRARLPQRRMRFFDHFSSIVGAVPTKAETITENTKERETTEKHSPPNSLCSLFPPCSL